MHPDVVKNGPGSCDICEMPLETPESLGFAAAKAPYQQPLVVPASAVLITGTRAIVYVKGEDPNKPSFEGRQVRLGPRAGEYYIVESGLEEGQSVVTKGNFKIDSALQIQAKPSMMNEKQ
jgi:Cu(I)/Ag(I) efflux system membrane fusion protein